MPISAPGNKRSMRAWARQVVAAGGNRLPRVHVRGFTLIEILVVMVIIAIILTMAMVNFGPGDG